MEEDEGSKRVDFIDFIRMTLNEEIGFLRGSTERITPDTHLDKEMFTDKSQESEVPMDTSKTKSLRESDEITVLSSATKQFSGSSKSCTEKFKNDFGDGKHSNSSKVIFKDIFGDFYKVNLRERVKTGGFERGKYHDSFFFLFKEPYRNSKGDDSISKEEDNVNPPLESDEENDGQNSHQNIVMNRINISSTNI